MLNKKVIINTEIGEKKFAIDKIVNKYSKEGIFIKVNDVE